MSDYMYWAEDISESIEHHGIFGQKWGVRKYQYEDGSLTPEGRRRYLKGEGIMRRSDAMRGERTIKAGTAMYRTTANSSEKMKGSKYVTYADPDRDYYRSNWYKSEIQKHAGKKETDPVYEMQYVLKEDLKIPARAAVKQIELHLMQNETFRQNAIDQHKEHFYKKWIEKDALKDALKDKIIDYDKYEDMNDRVIYDDGLSSQDKKILKKYLDKVNKGYDEVLSKAFTDNPDLAFTAAYQSLGGSKSNQNAVITELKKRGYNAMVDDAGTGNKSGIEGYDPLIIFDGADSLRSVKISEIDDRTAKIAGENTKKWRENTQAYVNKYKENW